ncbi:MAG: hypothetical protein Q8R28_02100 [Dehalococcoidia bacterium]|nr:hypothetical protein [Dehalococcoidia bacterium]
MGLDPLLLLMTDGPDPQVTLLYAKGCFCFGELDIGLPELLGIPIGDVAPQQVAALTQFSHVRQSSTFSQKHFGSVTYPFHDLYSE